jgi:hypothetical protein
MPPSPEENSVPSPGKPRWLEPLGWAGLAGLAIFFLATSWRKWPDSLVDFGRELYVPWRLANGAVLYREVDVLYGPLSQYLNATLFKCFGPGLMVLVVANLVVFAAITVGLYLLFRRAWGMAAALVSCAVFIAVFGFSQLDEMGNFNYATPYAHEVTHGLLACLLLTLVLVRWIETPTTLRSLAAGVLFGLTTVLKPEIMFAGGLVLGTAFALRWRQRGTPGIGALIAGPVGALLPTAGFTLCFARTFPLGRAFALSSRAWLSVAATTRYTGDAIQARFLGIDRTWPHLLGHGLATALALLLVAGLCVAARLAGRVNGRALRTLLAVLVLGGVGWLATSRIDWPYTGSCLLGLTLVYLISRIGWGSRRPVAPGDAPRQNARLLIAVLAAALMARMVLNGRIYEYGFYQAALAAMLVTAVLIGEVPELFCPERWSNVLLTTASLALLGCGAWQVAARSQELLRLKVYPLGSGRDLFYTYEPDRRPIGEVVRFACEKVRQYPEGRTLLVLPEGEMINYLTRRRSPAAQSFFYAAVTSGGGEGEIVNELQRHPPDLVVVLSRDLRFYGVARYGDQTGEGRDLLRWVVANYRVAWHIGGDPLDPLDVGGVILEARPGGHGGNVPKNPVQ